MPTYAYECQACGHGFEQFQSMMANALRKCPECGERKLQRLIGPGAGVIFKGSGFYETDYRSESYKKAKSEAEKSGSDASEDKSAAAKKTSGSGASGGSSDGGASDGGTAKSSADTTAQKNQSSPKKASGR